MVTVTRPVATVSSVQLCPVGRASLLREIVVSVMPTSSTPTTAQRVVKVYLHKTYLIKLYHLSPDLSAIVQQYDPNFAFYNRFSLLEPPKDRNYGFGIPKTVKIYNGSPFDMSGNTNITKYGFSKVYAYSTDSTDSTTDIITKFHKLPGMKDVSINDLPDIKNSNDNFLYYIERKPSNCKPFSDASLIFGMFTTEATNNTVGGDELPRIDTTKGLLYFTQNKIFNCCTVVSDGATCQHWIF